jgi:phosphoribosylformylglycinamidine synthase
LAVALAECCIAGQLGFEGEIESEVRPDALLFGEAQSRIIVSLVEEKLPELKKLAEEMNVKVSVLGTVKSDKNLNISVKTKGQVAGIIDVSIDEIAEISNNAIKRRVEYV